MDLTRTRVTLRERAVVDVLDLALRFVVDHGRVFAKAGAFVLPPFFLASVAVARMWGALAAWGFCLFAASLAAAPFTVLASRLVFEDEVKVLPAAAVAARRTLHLVLLRVATFLGAALGLLFFTVPGLWFMCLALFVGEVSVLEGASARAALSRSASMVRRESGQAVLALMLLALLHVVACIAADGGGRAIVVVLLESHAPAPMWEAGWSVLSLLGFWLFVPYAATARFLVYNDVRTRSEGWDIQTRFVAIASRALEEARRAA